MCVGRGGVAEKDDREKRVRFLQKSDGNTHFVDGASLNAEGDEKRAWHQFKPVGGLCSVSATSC